MHSNTPCSHVYNNWCSERSEYSNSTVRSDLMLVRANHTEHAQKVIAMAMTCDQLTVKDQNCKSKGGGVHAKEEVSSEF